MATESPGIPVIVLNEETVPAEHRFAAFRDRVAPLFDPGPVGDDKDFKCSIKTYLVDGVIVDRRQRFSPLTLRRTTGHLRNGTSDWVTVRFHHQGGFRGQAGRDTTLDLNPDRIGILDLAEPFAAWSDPSDSTRIAVPKDRIDEAAITGPAGSLDRSSTRGRVLDAAVGGLWRKLETGTADKAADLAGGIVETINTILKPGDFTPTDHDLALAMQDLIKANLSDLDLGVDSLPAQFHCSRATVYRLFEKHGGVATYIRDQRLLRCFEELTRPAKLPRRISEVATRWGFENPSHFNRIFKAKFGMPPSHLTRAIQPDIGYLDQPGQSGQVIEYHSWIKA